MVHGYIDGLKDRNTSVNHVRPKKASGKGGKTCRWHIWLRAEKKAMSDVVDLSRSVFADLQALGRSTESAAIAKKKRKSGNLNVH